MGRNRGWLDISLLVVAAILMVACGESVTNSPSPILSTVVPKTIPTIGETPNPLAKYEDPYCVFCFLDVNNPLEPIWKNSIQGYTYQKEDPREIIVIDENFQVQTGKNITFDNKIILIKPDQRKDITVFGTLTIKDSLLIWEQTEYQQTRLRIKKGGTLNIKDSFSFWGNQYWVNWEFEDGSTINFDHFIGDPWTTIQGSVNYTAVNFSTVKLTFLRDTHDTTVQISDAHHVWFELFTPPGNLVMTLPEKRVWADWNISDLWPNTTINVNNSYIYERDVSLGQDSHVTIQDTPSGFGLGWEIYKDTPGYVNCELKNLGEPYQNNTFYEDKTWDLPCNNSSLQIKNSLLMRAWPLTRGYVHLKIFDSSLVDPRNFGAPATFEIYDSTIDIIAAYKGGRVYLENSQIKNAIEVKDLNSAIYGFGATGTYELLESDGGVYIKLDESGPPWK